jgi:threonine dehydrogenase-like Zn-dependent dehydrogenase
MGDCLAAVITEFKRDLELQRVPLPALAPSSVLIKVDAATLCGTDTHRWLGDFGTTRPFVPGHETCGTIVEMRGEMRDILGEPLAVGDRIISSYPSCGHCYYCSVLRQASLCRSVTIFGDSSPGALLGGCAEYHYFPPGGCLIRVPDEVPPKLAASAACALRTVMNAFEQLGRVESHETVLILGSGPLGLYALAVARDRGARQTLMIGAPETRLAVAREWGADAVLNLETTPDANQRAEWVREHSGGRGADIVFQCAVPAVLAEGLEMVRPGGRLVSIGIGGAPLTLGTAAFLKAVRINLIVMAEPRHFLQAVDFLTTRRKRFNFEHIISGTYTLDKTTEALRKMATFEEVKPVILPTLSS